MDTWEFFQDAQGLWRWRCTRSGGQRVFNSTRAHPTREHAVIDAAARGYKQGSSEVDGDETSVTLRALREDQ